jgi:hypothetical protein
VPQEAIVIEPQSSMRETEESLASPRFQIIIIDAGWNSAAHKVLQENFGLLRDLQKGDPIYVVEQGEVDRVHPSSLGGSSG